MRVAQASSLQRPALRPVVASEARLLPTRTAACGGDLAACVGKARGYRRTATFDTAAAEC